MVCILTIGQNIENGWGLRIIRIAIHRDTKYSQSFITSIAYNRSHIGRVGRSKVVPKNGWRKGERIVRLQYITFVCIAYRSKGLFVNFLGLMPLPYTIHTQVQQTRIEHNMILMRRVWRARSHLILARTDSCAQGYSIVLRTYGIGGLDIIATGCG